eukprot:7172425-Lingulodinium_polyedra.AAC.1
MSARPAYQCAAPLATPSRRPPCQGQPRRPWAPAAKPPEPCSRGKPEQSTTQPVDGRTGGPEGDTVRDRPQGSGPKAWIL